MNPATFIRRSWWVLLVRGIVSIVFGVLAIIFPSVLLTTLVLLLGAWFIVDGVFSVVGAIRHRHADRGWLLLLFEGIVGVLAGLAAFLLPALSSLVLIYFFGAWSIITGLIEIVSAWRVRAEIEGEWALILSGALSVVIGIVAFVWPGVAALSLITVMAAFAIFFGILLVIAAFRVRFWGTELQAV